jgi:DHA1 family bicyclomycin/chloramphenicol resistance-like MFS transporter
MPHVRRSVLVTIDAPVDSVREALQAESALTESDDGSLTGPFTTVPFTDTTLVAHLDPTGDTSTALRIEALGTYAVPFFGWFVGFQAWLAARGALKDLAARVVARLEGRDPPSPPRRWPFVPPVPFTTEEAARLAALAFVALVANFCGGLLTQNGDAVTDTFHQSDQALGLALAVARIGVVVSLVMIALADRLGRRKLILFSLAGACAANLVAGLAPSFEVFTGAQLFTRAFVNACLVVAGIAAVEEAPEGARAFATAMFALALGVGIALGVIFLPFADLGNYGWRISFIVSAGALFFLPFVGRQLRETRRYNTLVGQSVERGRLREVFASSYRARFVLLGLVAFVTNVFIAPSSQLTNRYLTRAHDFSNSDVAGFRTVTAGLPGVIGVLLAGRLTESRGRRPVAVVGLLVATAFQMLFFVANDDALLWVAPTIAIVAAACAGLALGTLDAELFPTETRGTSNGFLLVAGVAGSAVGLVVATQLRDLMGGLGPAIAVCGIPTLIAAILLVPRLPETATRSLDDVSPTEIGPGVS